LTTTGHPRRQLHGQPDLPDAVGPAISTGNSREIDFNSTELILAKILHG